MMFWEQKKKTNQENKKNLHTHQTNFPLFYIILYQISHYMLNENWFLFDVTILGIHNYFYICIGKSIYTYLDMYCILFSFLYFCL